MPWDRQEVAEQQARCGATRNPAILWEITRRDGQKLRLTGHDRHITEGGNLYQAGVLATIGQLRRVAGLEPSSLEASGLIDGTILDIPSMKGNLYRGATVIQRVVNWRMPYSRHFESKWWITRILHDGSGMFRGILESVASRMQLNAGGRFGGLYDQDCPYNYGDPTTCKKDISADTYADVVVDVVDANRPKYVFEADNGTFPAGSPAHPDDFYRQGEVEWTVGNNVGTIQEIAYFTQSTRAIELYLPTPYPVEVGDEFTVRPGCQGTFGDCQARANTVNFGGRGVYAPGAAAVLSPEAQGNDP